MHDGLAVGGGLYLQSAFLPHPYDAVVLSLQFFEQPEGAVGERLVALVSAVGKEDRDGGVEDEHSDRLL